MQSLTEENLIILAQKIGAKPAEIEKFLSILYQEGPIENNALILKMGLPKSILNDIKRELGFLLEKPSQFTSLSPRGRKIIAESLLKQETKDNYSARIKELLSRYVKARPLPKRRLDQFWASNETIIKRALLMKQEGDLKNREILFLGDSDLTSIAVALTKEPRTIQVLDIDRDLLEFIREVSQKENLKISGDQYDVRQKPPTMLEKRFDTVFMDPPYTPEGLSLFLSRGIQMLKPENTSSIYFCYGHSRKSSERELKTQEILVKAGLLIRTKLVNFNYYKGAESIGSTSSLYIVEITPRTKVLIKGPYRGDIYSCKFS